MKLKISTKTYHEVDAYSLSAFIKEVYGHNFEFVADQECGNDSSHTFEVSRKNSFEDLVDDMIAFKDNGKYAFMAGPILNDLCDQDLIPAGTYLISVSW